MEKVYLVQVFHEVYDGVRADKPLLYGTEGMARKRAEALARDRHGVLVYAQAADADRGEYSEPVILAKYGQVPASACAGMDIGPHSHSRPPGFQATTGLHLPDFHRLRGAIH